MVLELLWVGVCPLPEADYLNLWRPKYELESESGVDPFVGEGENVALFGHYNR
jgi:hypothetical protein